MKKLLLLIAATVVTVSAFAVNSPLGSTWGVNALPTDGFHGNFGGGMNELVGYQAGPTFSANGTLQLSYGLDSGYVLYGSVQGLRSWDALPNTPNDGTTARTGNNINSLFMTWGAQKSVTPNLLVGAQITYGNYALAPASTLLTVDNEQTTSVSVPSWVEADAAAMGGNYAPANELFSYMNEHYGTNFPQINALDGWYGENMQLYYDLTNLAGVDEYHNFIITTTTGSKTSPQLDFKTVGFGFNPYAQYTFGQSTVYGSYTLQELQNSGMQTIIGYTGSGVGHSFTGGYSYAMTPDLTVGLSGAYQIVNQPYTYAALVQYANSNNYQAAIGSEDYISLLPGVNYNISAVQGLSVGLNTGLTWFNFRKCNAPANGYSNFMSTFVFTPSVNYQIPLAENFVWSSNAQYNGVKMINASNPETGASMNGQTLNSSFQVTTGLTYSF